MKVKLSKKMERIVQRARTKRREFQRTLPPIEFARTPADLQVSDNVIGKGNKGSVVTPW